MNHSAYSLFRFLGLRLLQRFGLVALCVVSAGAAPLAIGGQEDFSSFDLEALMAVPVVTATRRDADPFTLPFAVSVRSVADFDRLQPRTLPLALEGLPGVSIQKTAYGQHSPYLRGFTGFRTLMLIDGISLNNSTFRDGPNQYWTTLDLAAFERLEVVAGPASVLYGSGSIGGTAQAVTPVTNFGSRDERWHAATRQRISTGEDSWVSRFETNGPVGSRTHARFGYTLSRFGDYRAGPAIGRVRHSGYDQSAFDAKLEHLFSPDLRLTFAHQSLKQEGVWRTHSTLYGSTWEGTTLNTDRERTSDQFRQLTYARLEANGLLGFAESAEVTLSLHRQNELGTRVRASGRRDVAGTDVDTYGFQLHFRSPTPSGLWTYGLAASRDEVDSGQLLYRDDGSVLSESVQGPVADDSHYERVGLYAQNELPAWGRLALTLRGRYDLAAARAGRVLDPISNSPISFRGSWDALVGSANATYQLTPAGPVQWLVYAGSSQGFRAPNFSDLSRLDSASSGRIETPTISIKPERYLMHEIGLKARSSRLNFVATFFYTDIEDMIIRQPTGRIVRGLTELTKFNSGQGYLQGAEGSVTFAFTPAVTVTYTPSWVRGTLKHYTSDPSAEVIREPVSRLPPFTQVLALRYTRMSPAFWVELVFSAASRQDRLSALDRDDTERIPPGGTPGYFVSHLRAGWTPRPGLSLNATVENVTDRDYRVHGSGVNEPGRNLVIAATLSF